MKVKSLSRARLLATPWTAAHQAPPSVGFSRREHWSGCHRLLHKKVPVPTISAYTRGGEIDSSEPIFYQAFPLHCARPGQDAVESHKPCVTASCSSTKKVATLPSSSFQTEICILLFKELYVTSYYPLPFRVYFLSTCSSQVYHPKLKLFS